jgi:hypothetical protein
MNKSTMLKIFIVLGLVAGTFLMVMPAQAKVAIGTSNGWEFSTDGFVNAFAIMEDQDEITLNSGTTAVEGGLLNSTDDKKFRVRTGLLPGLIAFNVKAPTTNGLDVAARVGFYPQIQEAQENGRIQFGSQIDLREIFMTADGSFGQILAGRALHLYQGKNILNDMTLFGVGTMGAIGSGGGTTLGYIGYGYIYTNFGAQFRYTSPDLGGLKLAVGILDPSTINGAAGDYDITESPGFEAEISYAGSVGGGVNLNAWINGMSQKAERQDTATTTKEATCSGVAAGVGVDVAGLHVLASGFSGQANGDAVMMATFATAPVDSNDEEREATGMLGQITYTIMGATKVGIQYGETKFDETTTDAAARAAGTAHIEKQSAYTLGVYHDITPNWKVMAEYTKPKMEYFDGTDLESSVIAVGTFFIW